VTTPQFIQNMYKEHAPEIAEITAEICKYWQTPEFKTQFASLYAKMPKINFDNAVLEKMHPGHAYVVVEDIGWSDVGAWEALKEALEQTKADNVTTGKVLLEDSVDTLAYNYEKDKLLVGIDLEDFLVVNTDDVLLVAKKTSVSKVKKLVEGFKGTEHEELT
jgi:mannose-1-phosphate guanylyltransferase